MAKTQVAVLGATGMVGQRFVTLLANHPWFEVAAVAASANSAGRSYEEAVRGRWLLEEPIPANVAKLNVERVEDIKTIKSRAEVVFCAINLDKNAIRELEDGYAAEGIPVVSNNSAHRFTPDVPMIIPEVNPDHIRLIELQKANRGWKKGFVVVKPNCSLQSYVPVIAAWRQFEPRALFVTTLQAISGSGKLLRQVPEIDDNVIPLKGEEEKSEVEPLKILGQLAAGGIQNETQLTITAHCHRVAANDGHMAAVSVKFKTKPSAADLLSALENWCPEPQKLELPSAPRPCLKYVPGDDRPQTKLDRDYSKGMGITVGRLRECNLLDYRFLALSHNTIRGAAGGAILTAELLQAKGYF